MFSVLLFEVLSRRLIVPYDVRHFVSTAFALYAKGVRVTFVIEFAIACTVTHVE